MMRLGRARHERGAAAVEFGLILPVLLLIVGGIIDFGIMYNKQILLTNAARDGVRQVVVNPATNGWTGPTIQNRIQAAANPLPVSSSAVDSTTGSAQWYCGPSGHTMTVTVAPTTPFGWTVLGFVPGLPTPTIKGTASMTCT
jgi:Flp pilus assembly protein TadG